MIVLPSLIHFLLGSISRSVPLILRLSPQALIDRPMRGHRPRGPPPQRHHHQAAGTDELLHDLEVAHSDIEALHDQLQENQVQLIARVYHIPAGVEPRCVNST